MKRKNFYIIFFFIFCFTICFVKRIGLCQETELPDGISRSSKIVIKRVAILPMVNLSRSDAAAPDVIAGIEEYLGNKRNIEVVSRETVEKLLVKERIRDIGLLSRAVSRRIGKILNVDGIVLTCINLLISEDNPMIGIGCRMLNSHDGSLAWYNHVSLAEKDFKSWFGLIKATSLEYLAQIAVERLLSSFPEEVKIKLNDTDPFDITEIYVNPRYINSFEKINVRVKFASMGKMIKEVNAILGSQKSSLTNEEELVFSGIFYTPGKEGKYLLNLEVLDEENNVSMFNSAAIIRVDNTGPDVALFSRDELFSPNGDRVKDMIFFYPYLKEADNIESWEFVVENSDDEVIRRAEGKSPLPGALVWRGEDDSFSLVADGKYLCSLIVIDKAGNETRVFGKEFILDNTAPEAQIIIDVLEKNGFQFHIECEDVNRIDRWQLTILDTDNRVVQSFEGDGNVPATIMWKTVPSAHIDSSYSFKAKDTAGNTLILRARPFKVEFLTKEESPTKEEEKKKEWDFDF